MIEKKTDIFLCFIDYTKAFDRINHERLISILKNCGIPTHEIRLISELCWGQKAVVRTTCGKNSTTDIKRGVGQGCILSPALFNLYSEQLLAEALSDTEGVLVNGKKITSFRYADDTVLIAKNESELREMINKVCDTCSRFGMALNAKETGVMEVSRTAVPHNMKMQAYGQTLEQVTVYKYLGCCFSQNGKCLEELKRRIGTAKSKFGDNKELLKRDVHWNLKLRMLKTMISTVASYGSEAWTYTKQIQQ